MSASDIILGSVLIAVSLALIVFVLMQHGKSHGLSGTIAGGAETFFGKSKARTIDKKLSVATGVVAIIFVILVLVVYLKQDVTDISGTRSDYVPLDTTTSAVAEGEDSTAVTTGATQDTASEGSDTVSE